MAATKTKRKIISKDKYMKLLSLINLMSNGKMFLVCKMPRIHSNKLSSYQFDLNRYLQAVGSLGKEFYFMVLQELERHF